MTFETFLSYCIPPVLALIVWFLNKLVSDNEKSHGSFSREIRSLKEEVNKLENGLIRLDVLQPKEIKDLEKMVKHQKSKMEEIEQKVKRHGEPGMKTSDEGERAINYGHFPDTPNKVIQVLDVPASVNAQNSAFKVEVIGRLERNESQLKTHEAAIGRIATVAKDATSKAASIVSVVKEIREVLSKEIIAHRKKKDQS